MPQRLPPQRLSLCEPSLTSSPGRVPPRVRATQRSFTIPRARLGLRARFIITIKSLGFSLSAWNNNECIKLSALR
jgi:hypothetical protein